MRTFGRVTAIMSAALASALALQGCASTGADSDTTVSKLTIWGAQSTTQVTKDLLEEYGEENGIEMDFVTIPDGFEANVLTKWTTGQRPDILLGQPGGFLNQLNAKKNLQDLSDMEFVSKIKYGLADAGSLDGVPYTATTGFPTVFGIIYNKDVFETNGLEPPATLEELQAGMETLKTAGQTPVYVAGGDTWTLQLPYVESMTDAVADGLIPDIMDGEAEWTDSAVQAGFDFLSGLVNDGYSNPDWKTGTFVDQAAAVESGAAAMAIQGTWMLPSITDTSKVGFAPFPTESGKSQWQTSNLNSLQLPKTGNAANEAAARAYVDWATVGDGYKKYLEASPEPSIIEGVADPDGLSEIQLQISEAFDGGGIPSVDLQATAGPSDVPSLLSQVALGTLTAKEATAQMQASFVQNAQLAGLEGF